MTQQADSSGAATDPSAATESDAPARFDSDMAGGSRRRRGCLIFLAVAVTMALVFSAVVLPSLGTPGSRNSLGAPGTVAFGAPGSGCAVLDPGTTFPRSATIQAAARLTRPLRAGETVTSAMTRPDGHVVTAAQTVDGPVSCLYQRVAPNLEPGHYLAEYRSGTEVLARGELTIIP